MPVTLQFVEDENFYDDVIEYVTHGWPTHVDVVIPKDVYYQHSMRGAYSPVASQYSLLGARPSGGVTTRPADYSTFRKVAQIALPASTEQEDRFYSFLKGELGKSYDFADVFGFVTNHFVKPKGTEFCSMLALSAINAGSIFPQRPECMEYAIDPWDLFLICSAIAPVRWIKK